MRTQSILLLCVASLLWGSGWIFSPELAEVAQPFAASALTMALAALPLGLIALLLLCCLRRGAPMRRSLLWPSLVLGLVMLAVPTGLSLIAGAHGIGGWPLLLYALLPLLTALPGEQWSMQMVLAAGAVFVLLDSTIALTPRTMAWALLVLLAAGLQAYGLRYAAMRFRGAGWADLIRSTAIQAALAALCLACGSLFFDGGPRLAPHAQWGPAAVVSLLYLGSAAAAAYILLYRVLTRAPLRPEQVAAGQWLQTLTAVAESAFFARARVPWPDWLAGAALFACFVQVLLPRIDAEVTRIALSDTSRKNRLP